MTLLTLLSLPLASIASSAFDRSRLSRARRLGRSSVATHLLPQHLYSSTSSHRHFSVSSRQSSSDPTPLQGLTHIDPQTGKPAMVSVTRKPSTHRTATAEGSIFLPSRVFGMISSSSAAATLGTSKGDVLSIAQLAGIMGSKATSSLIPLCHPLSLTHIVVSVLPVASNGSIRVIATAECFGPTGVEMEALMGVNVALLTVWDMLKAVAGKEMTIGDIRVTSKSGGKSGDWTRDA